MQDYNLFPGPVLQASPGPLSRFTVPEGPDMVQPSLF